MRVSEKMASLIRSILSILSSKVIGLIIGILFTPILVRVISQEQYGLYASVLAAYSVVALVSKGGIFDATRKIIAEDIDDSEHSSGVLTSALGLSAIYGTIGVGLGYLILHFDLIPRTYARYFSLLLLAILFENLFQVVQGYFHGIKKEHIGEVLKISRRIFYSAVALALAYIGYDLHGVFLGYTISFVVFCVIGLVVVYRDSNFLQSPVSGLNKHARYVASYGGQQLIGGVSALLIYKSDVVLVEFFWGSTSTALYNSAIVPAEMIWFIPSVIQVVFLQHASNLWSNDEREKLAEDLKSGVKYGVLSLALFGIGLFALSEPFLRVYFGGEYSEASTVLQILLFGTIFLGVSRILSPIFHATGWIRYSNLVTVAGLLLNIGGNIIMVPRFGIIGAGIATATSYVAILGGSTLIWWRSSLPMVSLRWTLRIVSVQLVFGGLYIGAVYLINLGPLLSLLFFPPVGLALFLVINFQAGYLSKELFENQLGSILGKNI